MNKFVRFFAVIKPKLVDSAPAEPPPYGSVPTGTDKTDAVAAVTYDLDGRSTLIAYSGLVVGVLGKAVATRVAAGETLLPPLAQVIVSFIIAAVVFASVYTKHIYVVRNQWLRFFIGVQNGFFFEALLDTLAKFKH